MHIEGGEQNEGFYRHVEGVWLRQFPGNIQQHSKGGPFTQGQAFENWGENYLNEK